MMQGHNFPKADIRHLAETGHSGLEADFRRTCIQIGT